MCLVAWLCLTLCDPMDCSLPGSSVHGDSPGKNTGVGSHTLLQGIFPAQRFEPRSPALLAGSLPSEPPGKCKNTEMLAYPFSRGPGKPSRETGSEEILFKMALRDMLHRGLHKPSICLKKKKGNIC
ncbi:unnamed protein product [Rangifer tarandus platyrhynchus]|uniref:Uncharacterized protein n=1 Tax=Rangifer tarandus platyrhynchus TaxID=3082113 RepID=A0AC59Z1N3_RANTA